MSKPFNFKLAEARWVLGLLPSEELPALATEALVNGFESTSLVALAGSERDQSQRRELFDAALRELGFGTMATLQALRLYAQAISAAILASEIAPLDGARLIWRVVIDARPGGFHELDPFIYAASEMEDRPDDKDFFEKEIREESRRWTAVDL